MSNPTGVTVVPGVDQHDMERRRQHFQLSAYKKIINLFFCRQIALKALSERLSKSYSDKQPLLPQKQNPKILLPPHRAPPPQQSVVLPQQQVQQNNAIPSTSTNKSDVQKSESSLPDLSEQLFNLYRYIVVILIL